MKSDPPSRTPFRDGFADVFRRTFSLDFSPQYAPPIPLLDDPRPQSEIIAENLASYWKNVGGYFWTSIGRLEEENPEISLGFYEKHLRETAR